MSDSYQEPPVVDCHAHIMTSRMPFRPDAWTRPDYEYPVEAYLADLDQHGISFGVIAAASLYGDYNDYTLEALDLHRRLHATVILDPSTDAETILALRDRGVVGVRWQWREGVDLPDLSSFEYRKFVNRLADAGMHVELNASAVQLEEMLPALTDTGVTVVVDHFGLLRSPDGLSGAGFAAVLKAIETGRVWTKISAGFRLDPAVLQEATAKLMSAAGTEKLLWGSDSPFVGKESEMTYSAAVEMFYDIVPDPKARREISDTALRFYFFD